MTTGITFSSDRTRIDIGRVHRWLAEESYWARGRSLEVHLAAMDGSRNYGVYDSDAGEQLGYARVITDGVTFAWVADVFVDPAARGRGVGVALVEGVMAELEPLGLKRTALFTEDAHGLYARFGFEPVADPERWMMRWGIGFGPAAAVG